MAGIEISFLGPLAVERDGAAVRLGPLKRRVALALLASRPGAVVSVDRLVEAIWGEDPPRTAATALHGHISQLRRLLGADVIATRSPGYVLELDPDAVDGSRFEHAVEAARGIAPDDQVDALRHALDLWRGRAFADLASVASALHQEAERLEEMRLSAQEQLVDARLALGEHGELVPELESLVREEPLRERAVGQLMLALYRGGRQADALAAYRRLRRDLHETLGLEPGQDLRDLERRILAHDPSLAPPTAGERPALERRLPLTAAVVGFSAGATAAELDAEAYAQAAAPAREAVRLAFVRHGGLVERAGSAVVGLFGVPQPHEDDAARAIAAAEAALAAIAELPGIQARAGVASGESFGGESAAIEHALRLQAEAAPGGVEVDEATRLRARSRMLRLDQPFAGRTAERRRLRKLYDASAEDGRSAVVTIVGPAGIGKSRLAEHLAAAVGSGARVLRARCPAYGDGIGLLPAAELVRGAAGIPADANEDAARAALAELTGADGAAAAAAIDALLGVLGLADDSADVELGWAVRRLLSSVADTGPVLVLVEDLHWARPVFLHVLEQLARPLDAPLVVVATARDDANGSLPGTAIKLAPLSAAACGEIVAEILGGEVEPASLQALTERSGGNPLFLEELVLELRASGRLRVNGRWHLDDAGETPPATIQSLLANRLERLPEAQRDLLARASVLDRSFTLTMLAGLAGDPGESLAALVADGLLQPAATADDLEFRHVLIRDAAYASLPLGLKAELHEHAAELHEGAEDVPARERDALAFHHLDQAFRARSTRAPDDPALAPAAAELAARAAALGRSSLARGDAAAASTLLARALELDPRLPHAGVELGRARFDAGDLAGADEAFAAAADGPDADRAALGRLEIRLHTDPDCDPEAAAAEIRTLLGALRASGDEDGIAEALLASAYVSLVRGRVAELDATLGEGLALMRGPRSSRAEAEILFLVCAASWYGPLPVAQGIARCEGVLADANERPNVAAAALQSLAVLHAMQGDFELARERIELSRSMRRETGQAVGAAASAIDAGLVELLAGDHVAAEAVLRGGYADLEALGETGYFSTVAGLLGEAVEAQGRHDEARELARAAAAASAQDDAASQVGWRVTEARCLAHAGDADEARSIAQEAAAIADATDFVLLRAEAWTAVADVATASGDDAAAEAARATALALLEGKGLAPAAAAAWARAEPAATPSAGRRRARATSR